MQPNLWQGVVKDDSLKSLHVLVMFRQLTSWRPFGMQELTNKPLPFTIMKLTHKAHSSNRMCGAPSP
jgi:hypothetical protein